MKLLFITQKIDEQDDDLAFVTQWVDEFILAGFEVDVICLQRGDFDDRFPVFSLGKEEGNGMLKRLFRFYKRIFKTDYDRVYVHMNPEYFTLGGWYWFLRGIPMYLWYTHYTMHVHLRQAGFYCKRMFAATKQSLPQYEDSEKKVVTGHGVDIGYWQQENRCQEEYNLIMVHRLSRSKRVELGILSLKHLPKEYNLTIYGRPVDPPYYEELQQLVAENGLSSRVVFKGPVPMPELRALYPAHRIMINMASETIDKTMIEAMCNGVFPVTTKGNMKAIGFDAAPAEDTPEAIADFIKQKTPLKYTQSQLLQVAEEKHSLRRLVQLMSGHVKEGN